MSAARRSARAPSTAMLRRYVGRRQQPPAPSSRGAASVARSRPSPTRKPAARRSWCARTAELLGVVQLKDIVKGGIRERFAELRRMGIRTVMITGDNPMTAAAIAAEAGVDDFLAQATPEDKLKLIREEQAARASSSPCAATAPTTPRRWRRPMSASP